MTSVAATELLCAAASFRHRVLLTAARKPGPQAATSHGAQPAASHGSVHTADSNELQQLLQQIEAVTLDLVQEGTGEPATSAASDAHMERQEAAADASRRAMDHVWAALQQADWSEALCAFLDAARVQPEDALVWLHAAVAAHKLDVHSIAQQAAERALSLGLPLDSLPATHVLLAHACEGQGLWQAAHAYWHRSQKVHSGSLECATPPPAPPPAMHLINTSPSAVAAGLARCARALETQAEEGSAAQHGCRPALPMHEVDPEIAAGQLEAAAAMMRTSPDSENTRTAHVEALILCGRLGDATAACATLSHGWDRAYCEVLAAVRSGQLARALACGECWEACVQGAAHGCSVDSKAAAALPLPPFKFTSLMSIVRQLQAEAAAAESALAAASKPSALACVQKAVGLARECAPFPGLLTALHCSEARAHLLPPMDVHTAHQAAARAHQLQPEAPQPLWLLATIAMDQEPVAALEHLSKLQTLEPSWPGLEAARRHAALRCLSADHSSSSSSSDEDDGGRQHTVSTPGAQASAAAVQRARALLDLDPAVPVTRTELARAYRKQAAVHHPDAQAARRVAAFVHTAGEEGAAAASTTFLEVRRAYELLLKVYCDGQGNA